MTIECYVAFHLRGGNSATVVTDSLFLFLFFIERDGVVFVIVVCFQSNFYR